MSAHIIDVSIVYALPKSAWRKSLTVPRGSTAEDVFESSKLFAEFPELETQFKAGELHFGVHSQRVDVNYLLEQGDRIEIYRKLTADPKDVRRELAKSGKTMSSRS